METFLKILFIFCAGRRMQAQACASTQRGTSNASSIVRCQKLSRKMHIPQVGAPAGVCGDLALSDINRARGKLSCRNGILTSCGVACFQELHCDDLERTSWDEEWDHSHLTFWSYSFDSFLKNIMFVNLGSKILKMD